MPPSSRFEPASIKNKIKRQEVSRKNKRAKSQSKLQKRLAQAKLEADDPTAKKKRLAENVPRTLDNTREFDPSVLTAQPEPSTSTLQPTSSSPTEPLLEESQADLQSDAFSTYFSSLFSTDPSIPPKVLITTSFKSSKTTYGFCDELVGIFPGAEFIRRKKGKGFEMGRVASWAGGRGYTNLMVVNEDMKKPNAITIVHLPEGPTAYFKLTSIVSSHKITGHAKQTPHHPELVLNGFVTRLGHAVGRMFQTLFPPVPEFQGRQVVTLHNQRDFLFFRRHRYAFRSTEKVSLQEIGPRFTLNLRSLRKGIPAVQNLGKAPKPLEFDNGEELMEEPSVPPGMGHEGSDEDGEEGGADEAGRKKLVEPPKQDEYLWVWKPELETTRRTFFL
ncbi:hypothetical protein JAAARDRAFT_172026 [Jaapia argillacea MUCL 33604]|uniref:Brix domain-containing protein n=1 Tax=Jaapia argillacea MUCL 33604 TaxID=933084 RepID=A0A067Q650_9AGAM|nr:hypothetical protein JAAARDRAFT_172026 [Jaapia argillacea MUCL 33604]